MLSLHAALKLEVLTPTCPGTGVKMLMLMAGIDTGRCSDLSSWHVRSRLCGGKEKEMRGEVCAPESQQKKGAPVFPAKGKAVASTGTKAGWITPKDAGNTGVGGLLPGVTNLGSRLYPLPCPHGHQG